MNLIIKFILVKLAEAGAGKCETLRADLSQYLRGHFSAKNGETKNAKPNLKSI